MMTEGSEKVWVQNFEKETSVIRSVNSGMVVGKDDNIRHYSRRRERERVRGSNKIDISYRRCNPYEEWPRIGLLDVGENIMIDF